MKRPMCPTCQGGKIKIDWDSGGTKQCPDCKGTGLDRPLIRAEKAVARFQKEMLGIIHELRDLRKDRQ